MNRNQLLVLCLILAAGNMALAQVTVVQGKVTDATTGDAIPFVNVVFRGTSIGTTTDFDGKFRIQTNLSVDSIQASYIG